MVNIGTERPSMTYGAYQWVKIILIFSIHLLIIAILGNCLTDGKELLGKWERVALPPRDIYHHSYESIRTVNVGNEVQMLQSNAMRPLY